MKERHSTAGVRRRVRVWSLSSRRRSRWHKTEFGAQRAADPGSYSCGNKRGQTVRESAVPCRFTGESHDAREERWGDEETAAVLRGRSYQDRWRISIGGGVHNICGQQHSKSSDEEDSASLGEMVNREVDAGCGCGEGTTSTTAGSSCNNCCRSSGR